MCMSMSFWPTHFRSHLSHGILGLFEICLEEVTAVEAFVDGEGEPVMEETESVVYRAADGLGKPVMEVVVRLERLDLLGEETGKD